jgi:hypothetical protein
MVLARAPVEHHGYNTNTEFANFAAGSARVTRRRKRAGFGFAIRDCVMICTRGAVIVAAAIINVIRRWRITLRKSGMLPISQPGIAQKR